MEHLQLRGGVCAVTVSAGAAEVRVVVLQPALLYLPEEEEPEVPMHKV
jgi:hypothetical protein